MLNDADAAGLAEMKFGAGAGRAGHRGHADLRHRDRQRAVHPAACSCPTPSSATSRSAARTPRSAPPSGPGKLHDLDWAHWAGRVDEYLTHLEALLWPDLFIIGGGVSRKADKFIPLLERLTRPGGPRHAAQRRGHRRRGADLRRHGGPRRHARGLSGPAAVSARGARRRAGRPSPRRSAACPKWNTLAASTASAPAPTAGGKWASSPAPPLAMTGTVTAARTAADQLEVEPGLGAVGVHRVEQDLPGAELRGPRRAQATASMPGAAAAAVRGHLEPAGAGRTRRAAGVHRQHHALRAEPLRRLGQQLRPGDGGGVQRHLVRARPAAAGPRRRRCARRRRR